MISNMFWVHSSIIRVINRSTDAHCSADIGAWAEKAPKAIGTSDSKGAPEVVLPRIFANSAPSI